LASVSAIPYSVSVAEVAKSIGIESIGKLWWFHPAVSNIMRKAGVPTVTQVIGSGLRALRRTHSMCPLDTEVVIKERMKEPMANVFTVSCLTKDNPAHDKKSSDVFPYSVEMTVRVLLTSST